MAIAIEGFSVVGLKSRIEENFSGGIQALSQIVPNSTELADDELWCCSFMASDDAEDFLRQLQSAGLNSSQGPDSDLVLVSEFDLSVNPYCEWLDVVSWGKGVIAQRQGSTPQKVNARQGWTPERGSGLSFVPTIDANLEFRRFEGNVHVYFDKEQSREVFVGRTKRDPDAIYKVAAAEVFKYGFGSGELPVDDEAAKNLRSAIVDLEMLARHHTKGWTIHFCLGKGHQALREFAAAYDCFHHAYALEQETECVLRELVCVCLNLGKADEAVVLAQKAAALQPDNVETISNLACAYLIAARLPEARRTIDAADRLKPGDRVNQTLGKMIYEVETRKRPQPHCMSDLMSSDQKVRPVEPLQESQSAVPKHKGFWSRLMFWKN